MQGRVGRFDSNVCRTLPMVHLIWCFICYTWDSIWKYLRNHLKTHSEENSNNVMFAHVYPYPYPQSTPYGALYVASLVYVYGWPLSVWAKVIQFTWENKHGCQNKTLATASFLLQTSLFKDHEDYKRELKSAMLQHWKDHEDDNMRGRYLEGSLTGEARGAQWAKIT